MLTQSIHSIQKVLAQPWKVLPVATELVPCLCLHKSTPFLSSCFGMLGNVVRMNARSLGPLPHFIFCEVSSLVGSNVMWNAIAVGKVFCKTLAGNCGRSMWTEKENAYPGQVSVQVSR